MKEQNEKTSARVASIAGDVLQRIKMFKPARAARLMNDGNIYISMAGLKMLAGSCLTQAANKTKKKKIEP